MQMKKLALFLIVAGFTITTSFWGCKNAVSFFGGDQYNSKNFSLNVNDTIACGRLQDSLFVTPVKSNILTDYDTTWTRITPQNYEGRILDSLSAHDYGTSIGTLTSPDSTLLLTVNTVNDTNYFVLDNQHAGNTTVAFYINDYVKLNLIGADGKAVTLQSDNLSFVTVLACDDIKSLYTYELTHQKYLVEVITSDNTLLNPFKVALVLP